LPGGLPPLLWLPDYCEIMLHHNPLVITVADRWEPDPLNPLLGMLAMLNH
jgi:hypothetical protein